MPRFVILTHDYPFPHYDFMLEIGTVLRTWRLVELPTPEKPVHAEALSDHRLAYLDYEGPVGGGRGSVARWDAGRFDCFNQEGPNMELELHGVRLVGKVLLRHDADSRWLMNYSPADQG